MRSFLFVPGDRAERFDKAVASGADAVIVDLEDAVAPQSKATARAALADWLAPHRAVLIRVNAPGTPWFDADMALVGLPGVRGVVLPKAERVHDIETAAQACATGVVLPLIETALGMHNVAALASTPGVQRLVFGTVDFQLDLRIRGDGLELLAFRSQLVMVSRVAGLQAPVDGVCLTLDDEEQLQRDALRARALGFGGKLCIHPRQIGPVNRAFAPTPEEVAWARRVAGAAADSAGSAVQLDGQMVDRPVLLQALSILDEIKQGARQ
jgi:citrate lyase subunit beta/citryl-CoA lyase